MTRWRVPRLAVVGVLAFFFCAYIGYPLAVLALRSLHGPGGITFALYWSLFEGGNAAQWEAMANSVVVSILSVLISGIIGTALAVVFTQIDLPGSPFLSKLAVLPVALPPLVGVLAFLFVFGETGIIPRGLQLLLGMDHAPMALEGLGGIVSVHVYSFHVYFYLFAAAALRSVDGAQLEAAAGMGGGPWRVFRSVILPALRPGLLAASALTFMASMASFTAPLLFAGTKRFLALQIFQTKLNGDLDLAAAQSVVLTGISLLFFILMMVFVPPVPVGGGTKGAVRPGRLVLPAGLRMVLLAFAVLMLVFDLLPVAVISLLSFAREGSWTTQWIPAAYTFENYRTLLTDPAAFVPITNSVLLAALTLAGTLLCGVPAAYLSTLGRNNRAGGAMQIVLTLPYALPGTVVGIALILAYNMPLFLTGGKPLVGTFWILPLAYIIREYPLVVRSTAASLERLDHSVLEAADGLGASPLRKFWSVALPAIVPGIVAGGVLVTIAALGEFVSSILLYTYASRPVSVEILAQLRLFNVGAAAAYSVVLMVLILLVLFLTQFNRKSRIENQEFQMN
ncbi:MAG: iron ABC transporter permease [Bacteroidota bacterium]